MLHEFITEHRTEILTRCRANIARRAAPRATDEELERGVPIFLDQIAEILRLALAPSPSMATSATKHGGDLLRRGFTIAQVVHDYGGVCQAITELAVERGAQITAGEFKTFNLCIDEAIADAVTEYGRLRADEGKERLGHLAHELGNILNSAFLAFEVLQGGSVGIGGSTGKLLGRSLGALRDVIGRELAEVRLGAGVRHEERVVVREFLEDLEVAATIEANGRVLQFSVVSVPGDVAVSADRQLLSSVVTNLLQNAFKFSRAGGHVVLRARATGTRVFIDVEDECGGLPAGKVEVMFDAHAQRSEDRSGVGLGLSIATRGAEAVGGKIHVRDVPGTGCVFSIELPQQPPRAPH